MNARSLFRRKPIAAFFLGVIFPAVLASCTTYNPYTGTYDYDPGKTMAAVGTAALVGSVAAGPPRPPRGDYRRPPQHHHYHSRGPRPGRGAPGRGGRPPRGPR